jgi:Anti-sigma-K factor rskA, C-terminal
VSHLDDDTLALLALGEPPDDNGVASRHLDDCPQCRAELERLEHTVAIGRSLGAENRVLESPPPRVWDAIVSELDLDRGTGTGVVELAGARSRRRRRWVGRRIFAVAAAVILILVVIGGVVLVREGSDSEAPLREVALRPVDAGGVSGRAQLVRDQGQLALKVDTQGLKTHGGSYYELWLMNPATNSFVSLGPVVPGTTGVHPIPPGVTVKTDPYVDISIEPLDGDPAHSTVSVLRGEFV